MLAVLGIVSALFVATAIFAIRGGRDALAERAAALGLAALLVALPLVSGRALADRDFAVSKHVRARTLIDALAAYYDDEGIYPEDLDVLIDVGLLESLPVPRIGSAMWQSLGFTDALAFDYSNLGSSYVLEFAATEWIMCSYNPPWDDESWDEEEDDFESDAPDPEAVFQGCLEVCHVSCRDDQAVCDDRCNSACDAERTEEAARAVAQAEDQGGEAWSCPDSRPELW